MKTGILHNDRNANDSPFAYRKFNNWKKAKENFEIHEKSSIHRALKSLCYKKPLLSILCSLKGSSSCTNSVVAYVSFASISLRIRNRY